MSPTLADQVVTIHVEPHQIQAAAVNCDQIPTIVADRAGESGMPLFACRDGQRWRIGGDACQRWLDNPELPVVDDLYRALEDSDEGGASTFSPVHGELWAQVLGELRRMSSAFVGAPCQECVFVVPAGIVECGRRKLIQSAGSAGWQCRAIMERSQAAAQFCRANHGHDRALLVLDFSRDALVASHVDLGSTIPHVTQSGREPRSGIGRILAQIAQLIPPAAIPRSTKRTELQQLRARWLAERIYAEATGSDQPAVQGWWEMSGDVFPLSLSRRHLVAMVRDVIERGIACAQDVLECPISQWSTRVDRVALIGDSFVADLSRLGISCPAMAVHMSTLSRARVPDSASR